MANQPPVSSRVFLHDSRYLGLAGDAEEPEDPVPSEARTYGEWPPSPQAPCPAGSGSGTAASDLELLRWQVTGIISSILEDHAPECAAVQSRLRECLAHNAGSPEKALLEHLLHLHGEPEEPQD
jgi:hypothetical protein